MAASCFSFPSIEINQYNSPSIMIALTRAARQTIRLAASIIRPTFPPKCILFGFSTARWDRRQFVHKLSSDISQAEKQVIDQSENEAYFTSKGWSITYIESETTFEFYKLDGEHEVKVITAVKSNPPNNPENYQTQALDDYLQKLNYSKVVVFLRKKQAAKWLAAEVAVLEGSVDLLRIYFSNQPTLAQQKSAYPGPQLSNLPYEVSKGMNMVLKELGVTSELLMNAVLHSAGRVDELNLKWLQNLKEMWA